MRAGGAGPGRAGGGTGARRAEAAGPGGAAGAGSACCGAKPCTTRPKCLKFAASDVCVAKSAIGKIRNKLVRMLVLQYGAHVECAFKLGASLTS